MPYDATLDKEIFSEGVDFENSKVIVSIFSYNNAESKLQITRQVKRTGGDWIFSRLGRLSKAETEAILPLIQKALLKM